MQEIVFGLNEASGQPVFLRLSQAIIEAIEQGRLKPGQRLPGTRTLAATLKLHRNTVDAAYHEAAMQGWLVTEAARGTFVARDLPVESGARRNGSPPPAAQPTKPSRVAADRDMLRFSDGVPDARLLPSAELARAVRHALRRPDFLTPGGYGDPRGAPALRDALAGHLASERGMTVSADDLIVTRGSQMALFLAANVLLSPGEAIAVEEPGYPLAVSAFRAAGARVVPIPVDGEGLSLTHLEAALAATPGLRAVYVTPHHQYPTTVTMSAARRIGLIDLAARHPLAIIEDDYDHEYRFDGRPVLPLAARAGSGVKLVYVGSLSKVLAPGIRLGYAAGPRSLVQRMADTRQAIDRQGDMPIEHAVATLFAEGDLGRHVRKTRRIYRSRRDHLAMLLGDRLGSRLSFAIPAGGLALWARLADGVDAECWSKTARGLGLAVTPGVALCIDTATARQAFRLGFANLDEDEITRAVELLTTAAP
ncbi:PLP-dependent aminotransferase family protein [Actinomadura yumaensis]|uniref:MocR-like pyridoxine biosynthesis transcription factor PdxR n=1 Tax=Brevundimonas sp. TaxID=1871086 RepID=UPI0016004239|nr:PLP-dependent aminotransferase family protein [Brevundimonas sp.]MBB1178618.1 PLP-dependent aminotransferase family protein [Pseudomonas sp. FW305-3-2-15-E-TSA4]MBJ7510173.1 PLP-dependent aminotransferase family protein [Brevundimonas sp.]